MTSQGTLFTPPPLPPAEEAERLLVAAFAKMLIHRGIGSLSDAREWLPDRDVIAAIPRQRFGCLPKRLGDAIQAVDVGKASHPGGGSHLLLVYTPRDQAALRAIAGGGGA